MTAQLASKQKRRAPFMRRTAVVGTLPLAMAVMSAGVSVAAPSQPGVTPEPSQPGVTPEQSQPSQSQPGVVPDPPVEPSRPLSDTQPQYSEPSPQYSEPSPQYSEPSPQYSEPSPKHSQPKSQTPKQGPVKPKPKPGYPYAPIIAPPGKVRVGDFMVDKPAWMSPQQQHSINVWSAYEEWRIAKFWVDHGVSNREADRRAATAVTGAVAGGLTAGSIAMVPGAIVGGIAGAGIGAVTGAAIGCGVGIATSGGPACPALMWPGAGIGALAGAGAGVAAGGAAGFAAGAAAGGLAGGALGNALGGGNPNENPLSPDAFGNNEDPNNPQPENFPQPESRAAVMVGAMASANAMNQVGNWYQSQHGPNAVSGEAGKNAVQSENAAPAGQAVVQAGKAAGDAAHNWVLSLPGGKAAWDAADHALSPQVKQFGVAAYNAASNPGQPPNAGQPANAAKPGH